MTPEDFSPPGHVGFALSFVLLLGLLGVGWGAFVVSLIARAIHLGRVQRHEHAFIHERASWQLLPGPSRVVHGRVEVDGESAVAIEIDVTQSVVDRTSKSARWHDWTESSRSVDARPFRLVRDDGQTVLVQPGDDVLVVDALETRYPDDRPRARVRSAIVRAGEEVFVYGELTGAPGDAYRGSASFVLARPRRGRMLVATDAIRDRYRGRIRFSWLAGLAMAAAYLVFHAIFTTPFVAAMLLGTHERATIVGARTYTTSGKSGPIHHWQLTARADDGFTLRGDVMRTTYNRVATGSETIPILRVGDSHWMSYLGDEPTVHFAVFLFAFFGVTASVLLAFGSYERTMAWYDRKRVVERGGNGHWVETRRADGGGVPIDPTRN